MKITDEMLYPETGTAGRRAGGGKLRANGVAERGYLGKRGSAKRIAPDKPTRFTQLCTAHPARGGGVRQAAALIYHGRLQADSGCRIRKQSQQLPERARDSQQRVQLRHSARVD